MSLIIWKKTLWCPQLSNFTQAVCVEAEGSTHQGHEVARFPGSYAVLDTSLHLIHVQLSVRLPAWSQFHSYYRQTVSQFQVWDTNVCCRVFLHLPSGSTLHFPETGSLCRRLLELLSKRVTAWSTSANKAIVVNSGLTSSALPYTVYFSLTGWGGVPSDRLGFRSWQGTYCYPKQSAFKVY